MGLQVSCKNALSMGTVVIKWYKTRNNITRASSVNSASNLKEMQFVETAPDFQAGFWPNHQLDHPSAICWGQEATAASKEIKHWMELLWTVSRSPNIMRNSHVWKRHHRIVTSEHGIVESKSSLDIDTKRTMFHISHQTYPPHVHLWHWRLHIGAHQGTILPASSQAQNHLT